MKNKTIYQSLVTHFGDQTATGVALGVSQPTVSGWINGVHGMKPSTAIKAEKATDGLFKAVDLSTELAGLKAA